MVRAVGLQPSLKRGVEHRRIEHDVADRPPLGLFVMSPNDRDRALKRLQ